MADRDETLRFKVEQADRAADALRDVTKEGKKTQKQLDNTAKQSKKSAQAAGQFTDKLAKMGVTLAAAKALLIDTTMLAGEQEAAIGRLDRAWGKADTTGESWNSTLDKLKKRSTTLGVSYQAQVDGLTQLIDQTGSAKTAHEDLALAIDIAAAENRELKDTVEILRKARNGEVEEIKALDGVNKDLAESIGKIESPTLRAKAAIEAIRGEYTGAAEDTKGLENRMKALEEGSTRLAAAFGKVVVALGDQAGGLVTGFLDWTGILDKEQATIDNVVTSFENFADAITRIDGEKLLKLASGGGLLGALTGHGPAADVIREIRGEQAAERAAEDEAKVGTGGGGPRRGRFTGARERVAARRQAELDAEAAAKFKPATGGKKGPEHTTLEEETAFLGDFGTEDDRAAEAEAFEKQRQHLLELADLRAAHHEAERQRAEEQGQILLNKLDWDQQQIKSAQAVAKAKKAAGKVERQAAMDGAMAALEGVALFDKAGKLTLAANAVKTGLRAGEAWAMAATPPPIGGPQFIPGAISLTANAVAQAAEAGKALAGGTPGPKGGAGGSGAASSSGGGSAGSATEAFDLTGAQRPSGGITDAGLIVNLYSTHPATPEQARDLFEAVESERGNRPQGA